LAVITPLTINVVIKLFVFKEIKMFPDENGYIKFPLFGLTGVRRDGSFSQRSY